VQTGIAREIEFEKRASRISLARIHLAASFSVVMQNNDEASSQPFFGFVKRLPALFVCLSLSLARSGVCLRE
jgi:hypothetical protein